MEYAGVVFALGVLYAMFRFGGRASSYTDMKLAEAEALGKAAARSRMKQEYVKLQRKHRNGLESFDDLVELLDGDFTQAGNGNN